MIAILGRSWLIAWLAQFFRPEYVGLLGVVPVILGIRGLFDRFVRRKDPSKPVPRFSTRFQILTVAVADVAHGPDTIVLYSALLADADALAQFAVTVTYLVLVLAWCSLGLFLFRHPRVREPAQKYGHTLSPFVLIGVGVYILMNTVHDLTSP